MTTGDGLTSTSGTNAQAPAERCASVGDRFKQSIAVVVGIDSYQAGIPRLDSAVEDARLVASTLEQEHAFTVTTLYDGDATVARLKHLVEVELSSQLEEGSRLLFYFAGHGVALDGDEGLAGYLLLSDAVRGDPGTYLPMPVLHDLLTVLPCRHCFMVLDCCFAGGFRWSTLRDLQAHAPRVYRERFDRFVDSYAWQVLTSAASDQPALDRLVTHRGEAGSEHSPFASAFIAGMNGAADHNGDGLVTVSDLAVYVRDQVETQLERIDRRQTPQLFLLNKHERGEFVFQAPNRPLRLPPAPALTRDNNPYLGLHSFEQKHAGIFFGRRRVVDELLAVVQVRRLTVVVGASGVGKSSVVQAGLLPTIAEQGGWLIVGPREPGQAPLGCLRALALDADPDSASPTAPADRAWLVALENAAARGKRLLVVIDQLEELITLRRSPDPRSDMLEALAAALRRIPSLHVVVTVRSDFEPQFQDSPLEPWWNRGRFPIPPMSRAELRAAIEQPASAFVVFFEPATLVERIIDDVALLPTPLPLLSFALSELYRAFWDRKHGDRALTEADYERIGTVTGALTNRADAIHDDLMASAGSALTLRNIMMRMVFDGVGDVARRRVGKHELEYEDPHETARVDWVLERLHEARLVSLGSELAGEAAELRIPYAEPTHDELIRGWSRMPRWLEETKHDREIVRALSQPVRSWHEQKRDTRYLWTNHPRLTEATALCRSGAVLNKGEAAFVRASSRQRLWRRIRLWSAAATIATVLAVATVAALGSAADARRAGEDAKRAAAAAEDSRLRELAQRASVMAKQPGQECAGLVAAVEAAVPYASAGRELPPALFQALVDVARYSWCAVDVLEHSDGVRLLGFSRDGTELFTVSGDKEVALWDAVTGEQRTVLRKAEGMVLSASLSPDGSRIATGGSDPLIRVWNARDGAELTSIPSNNPNVNSVAYSPDGRFVAAGCASGNVWLWPQSAGPAAALAGHTQPVVALDFSDDGTRLLTAGWDSSAIVWNVARRTRASQTSLLAKPTRILSKPTTNGATVATLTESAVQSAVFSKDGKRFAISGVDGRIIVSQTQTGRSDFDLPATEIGNTELAFSAIRDELVSISSDGSIRVWDLSQKKTSATLMDHTERLSSVCFSPGGEYFATAGDDRVPRLWDAGGKRLLWRLSGHQDKIHRIRCASQSGEFVVATASADRTARIWRASRGRMAVVLPGLGGPILPMVFSKSAGRLVIGTADYIARIWDTDSGRLVHTLEGHTGGLRSAQFSPSERRLVTAADDSTARVWNTDTGSEMRKLRLAAEDESGTLAPAFIDDDTLLVSDGDQLVRWHVGSGRIDRIFREDEMGGMVLSPSRSTLATFKAGEVVLRDPSSGAILRRLGGHYGDISTVRFSRDGGLLVTAGSDPFAIVWDVATGNQRHRFDSHVGGVVDAAFSPDGRLVVTASRAGTVSVWELQKGAEIKLPGEIGMLHEVLFVDGGRSVLGVGFQGVVLWRLSSKERLASLGEVPDDFESVVTSENGGILAIAARSGSVRLIPSSDAGLVHSACKAARDITKVDAGLSYYHLGAECSRLRNPQMK
jgi:WD40 repeat protein